MKLNRIGSFVIVGLALVLILSQSASVTVKAQVSGFSASLSQQPKTQNRQSKIQSPTDQAPYKVTVQGRLTDPSGNPITSAVNVSFNVYTSTVGGSPIFSEGPVSVTPDNRGLLTYQLGSTSVISTALVSQFANTLYLGLTVGSDAEMAPRILLTAAPYAMSLAPGTVVQGAYDSSVYTTNFGVINGVNLDGSSVNNAGLYGKGATGVYGEADPSRGFGAYAGYFTNPGGYASSQFGIFASTNSTGGSDGYSGYFYNSGGGSGNQYGVQAQTTSTGGNDGYGGKFSNAGGGSGTQYGVSAETNSTGGGEGYGGSFNNAGGGNGTQYGVRANVTSTVGTNGYGGYFNNVGGGSALQFGIYSYAPTFGGPGGYSGFFNANSSTSVSVFVNGKVQATGGCCGSSFYDIQVKYHGSSPLHPGDVVAMDGNNEAVDGTPTLGVVKADAGNADLAVGVVQYRMKKIGTEKDGHGDWQVDEQATNFGAGDLLSAVVLGQVRMKVAGASFGQKLALDATGAAIVAANGADNIIGKVANQPDKDGYATVFVNLK